MVIKLKKSKDDKLVIRIDTELKEKFTKYVEDKGATVSDYLRQMIVEEMMKEEISYKGRVLSVKEYMAEYHSPEAHIARELTNLKDKMLELEYIIKQKEINKQKENK